MIEAIRTIDLHGQNVYQAEVIIESALRRSRGVYIIRLIHGHHSGTSLRDFIYDRYYNDPRLVKFVRRSPGVSELHLKHL